MAAVILALVILVATLVMLSGVWVATVLIGTIAHTKRSAPSARDRVIENTGP